MMKSTHKTLALWAFVLVGLLFLMQVLETKKKLMVPEMNYSKFIQALDENAIASVTFHSTGQGDIGEIRGEIKDEFKEKYKGEKFAIDGNIGSEGLNIVREKGLVPNFDRSDNSFLTSFLVNSIPMLLIIIIFVFLFRQIQAGGGKAMSFGKSRARLLTENKNKVTFKDVAGVEEAKEDLKEVVYFLKDPKKYTKLGGKIPKGVLMVGPPGTGKTLLARAVAGEAGVPFFTISGSDFVEMFVGVGASRVRDLFEQGKKNAPCLIFIDEIDAVGRHRGAGMGGGHDEREQTLNQLLVEMDGFESNEGVILIAATNRPDVLDPALLRPGRFDRRVVVSRPDLGGREKILEVHTKKTPLASDVNIKKVAQGTPGFSGADLANLVNEAALHAARYNKNVIEMKDFENAKDKILMGAERRSMVISEEDKKITAYHEAGHTLVAKYLKNLDPIHKVTIIPRGMALGVTQTLPEKEALNMTKSKAENMLAFIYGGRAAEELVFKDYTTGAGNDIEKATELARRMVCEWGMSEKIGPIALEKQEGQVFLGMQSQQHREYSDSQMKIVDEEIFRLIDTAHKKAIQILSEHRKEMDVLSEALLKFETVDGVEVQAVVDGATIEEIEKKRIEKEEAMSNEQQMAARERESESKAEDKDVKDPVGQTGPVTA